MGYQKGSITLNPLKDIPLLLQVLHARFITHDQLFEFMVIDCVELKRKSFNWRAHRLVEGGLLAKNCVRPVTPSPVYSLTEVGALMLSEHSPVLDSPKGGAEMSSAHVLHSIGLTGLHLNLARQGVLQNWESEVTIRARNELTNSGYAKDYDAVVTVDVCGRPMRFALEYERTPKKARDYVRIRTLLEEETGVQRFLYIVPEAKLADFILECFAGTTAAVLVGLVADFNRPFAEITVRDAGSGSVIPILDGL